MFVSQAETNVFRKRLFCGQKLKFSGNVCYWIYIYIYIYIYICIYVYVYICIYVCGTDLCV